MKKAVYLSLVSFLYCLLLVGQTNNTSTQSYNTPSKAIDTAVVNKILKSARSYFKKGELDKSLIYLRQAKQLAEVINYRSAVARCYNYEGMVLYRKGKYLECLESTKSGLSIAQEIGDSVLQSASLNYIGNVYSVINPVKALEYYFKGLAIEEKLRVPLNLHWYYNNIGSLYLDQKNYSLALEYCFKAIKVEEKLPDKSPLTLTHSNIGDIYSEMEKNDSALFYYTLSLEEAERSKDNFNIANALENIALINIKLKQFNKAREFSIRSSEICKEKGFKDLLVNNLNNLGIISNHLRESANAEHYFMQALDISKSIDSKFLIKESYFALANFYEKVQNYNKAYYYYELFSEAKDSLLNQQNSKLTTEMNMKYTAEKKEREIEILKKNEEIQKLELAKRGDDISNQRNISVSISIGFLLLIIVVSLTFSRYRLKKKAINTLRSAFRLIEEKNAVIETANILITDSITYAKRIQDAILPTTDDLSLLLPDEYFILYKPLQIVSGDFYWCSAQHNKIIFIVADCTGHGVPGALMSMIGNTLLNEIVNERKVTDTKTIAELLDQQIIHSLHQHSDSQQFDGMDISICCIHTQSKEISYTGAQHSMYIFNNDLTKVKGNSYSVGGSQRQNEKKFTSQVFPYETGMNLYFLSDGYCDQPGGEGKKRFNSRRFEDLLKRIQSLKMSDQKKELELAFDTWKHNTSQRDDVLIVGIKC